MSFSFLEDFYVSFSAVLAYGVHMEEEKKPMTGAKQGLLQLLTVLSAYYLNASLPIENATLLLQKYFPKTCPWSAAGKRAAKQAASESRAGGGAQSIRRVRLSQRHSSLLTQVAGTQQPGEVVGR